MQQGEGRGKERGGSTAATNQPTASNFCLFCSVVQLTGVMFNSPYASSRDEEENWRRWRAFLPIGGEKLMRRFSMEDIV